MGKFQQGQPKPENSGRKIGTLNKKTLVLREALETLGLDLPAKIVALLPSLSSDKQVDVCLHLMQYVYPKKKAIELSGDESNLRQVVVIELPDNGKCSTNIDNEVESF